MPAALAARADRARAALPAASDAEIEAAARAAAAHAFITELPSGYDTVLGEGGATLSGGQRLSIARAFRKDARVLILDEPTSALDTIAERPDRRVGPPAVGRTHHVRGRAPAVHRARRRSHLVLERGRIVAEGSHDQLRRTSVLYRQLAAQLAEPTAGRDATTTAPAGRRSSGSSARRLTRVPRQSATLPGHAGVPAR